MSVISLKPLEWKRQRLIVGLLLGLLIGLIVAVVVGWLNVQKTTPSTFVQTALVIGAFVANVVGGILASLIFGLITSNKVDHEYRQSIWREVQTVVDKTIEKAIPGYAPSAVYTISDEEDPRFHRALLLDLRQSEHYFFSGFSARVALARLNVGGVGVIRKCVFRLPLSEASVNRALTIFHDVRATERSANPKPKHNSEFFGFEGDREELLLLVRGEDFAQHRSYIKGVVNDSILFAYHLMRQHHWMIDILDWDGLTESRVEHMDAAAYIGNYHPLGEKCNFEPGTVRFAQGSFVWSFLNDGIKPQFDSCDGYSNEGRLQFVPNDTEDQTKAKLAEFLKDSDFIDSFSPQLAKTRFEEFKLAYPRKEEVINSSVTV
jgi:hypothetical protein